MKIVRRKHNLIIYSSVGSGNHDKDSFEIPHEYLSRQGSPISIKRNN